uniref:IFT81 calponin homology domain-containing protein n=1 Tax=Ditylenchus dipsaci TaxID=166011 RepID=A0A915D572_9BILA
MRTIVEGLNAEPFNRQLTMVKFDSRGGEKLLQTLSDVLGWIQGDIDHIQKWRLDILEGNKTAIYPVLEWMFDNVDRLKERVYLASFLTKVEVPVEEQSPDVLRVINLVEQKMQEFKEVHGRIVESRSDFVRAEDIHADLKAMTEEKEQLSRKIERSRRKVARRPDLDKCMTLAARLRHENEKNQDLQIQRQEQRNALVHTGQRLNRLERTLNEIERERETNDPRVLMNKMKFERLNKTDKRDKKDEASEDKLVIYRHQSTNIQRKKANIADSLHSTRQELDHIEAMIMAKKTELTEKSGKEKWFRRYSTKSTQKFKEIKQENINEGRGVIETMEEDSDLLNRRPKTAKPTTTDVRNLKSGAEELSNEINQKRSAVQQLNQEIESFYHEHKNENEQFYAKQAEFETSKERWKKNRKNFDRN